jgi:hypothetical protein
LTVLLAEVIVLEGAGCVLGASNEVRVCGLSVGMTGCKRLF